MSLSIIMIAKNEAHIIQQSLEAAAFADEIIVLDSGSSDNTIEIAKQFTDKVYSTDWQGYGVQKNRALSYATKDWVLNIDADEIISEQLKQDILTSIHSNSADAYRIPILLNLFGKTLKRSASPTRHVRLFKRNGCKYSSDIVHEKIILPDNFKVEQLKAPLLHHSFKDISHAIDKMNKYSSYSAKIKLSSAKTPGMMKAIMGSLWMFLRVYFIQGGFIEGRLGFLMSFYAAEGSFYRTVKVLYPDSNIRVLPEVIRD